MSERRAETPKTSTFHIQRMRSLAGKNETFNPRGIIADITLAEINLLNEIPSWILDELRIEGLTAEIISKDEWVIDFLSNQ